MIHTERCPFCKTETRIKTLFNDMSWVVCRNDDCEAQGPTEDTPDAAAAKRNNVVEVVWMYNDLADS